MKNQLKTILELIENNNSNLIEEIKDLLTPKNIEDLENLIMLAENVKCDIEAGNFDITIQNVDTDFYTGLLQLEQQQIEEIYF